MFVCLFPEFLAPLQYLGDPTAPTVMQPLRKHKAVNRPGTPVWARCYQIPPMSSNSCVTQGTIFNISDPQLFTSEKEKKKLLPHQIVVRTEQITAYNTFLQMVPTSTPRIVNSVQ